MAPDGLFTPKQVQSCSSSGRFGKRGEGVVEPVCYIVDRRGFHLWIDGQLRISATARSVSFNVQSSST